MARRRHAAILLVLALLAVVAYLPMFQQPLLQDDYPNLEQARIYGPVSGWHAMFAEGTFRLRATFYVLTAAVDRLFGPAPLAFHATSLALHILCTWLVYALGSWRIAGWRISAAAAAFFAVHEGHQEAVMWYSASSELLMFLFGMASLLCWIRLIEKQGGWRWYAASLACFVLALLSKESAVILAALFLLPLAGTGRRWRGFLWWLPFGALAALDVWLILGTRAYSFRFHDGSFSLAAPFWITLPVSCARLLWVWGFLALLVIAVLRVKQSRQILRLAAIWIPLALLPYSFLLYMHRVPSRQTYLASLGLAWIVGAGFWALQSRMRLHRHAMVAAVVVLVLAANIGYLWTKKRHQFLERAAPVEALIALAHKTPGPIYMRCYPDPQMIYEAALRIRLGKAAPALIWDSAGNRAAVADFCWDRR
jgi:hypothetical protein